MNTRKIIIILIVILLVAAIGYGVWNLFLREPQGGASGEDSAPMMPQATTATATSGFEETAGDRGEEGEDDILPQPDRKEASESQRPVDDGLSDQESKASSEKLKVLTENEVLGATLTQDEADLKYYRKKDGYVFRTDFEGQKKTTISDVKIEGLERVLWSPFKNKVITYRKQDGDLIKTFYSYEDGRHAELDPRMEKIDWSPSGQGIIYHFVNPRGESTISISWPDGSEWRRITKMEIERVQVAWPSSLMISVATPGASFYSSSLTLMSLNEDSQRKIAKGIDVDVPLKWHPKGRMFLYKRTDRENLYLYDLETGGQNLELEAAPSKCSWSKEGRSIFCAVTAENIIEQGLLPESYARRLLPQSDSFWQIDLEEKKVRELYIPESQENVINVKKDSLLVSPNQDYLFWVDSGDGKLYRLKL